MLCRMWNSQDGKQSASTNTCNVQKITVRIHVTHQKCISTELLIFQAKVAKCCWKSKPSWCFFHRFKQQNHHHERRHRLWQIWRTNVSNGCTSAPERVLQSVKRWIEVWWFSWCVFFWGALSNLHLISYIFASVCMKIKVKSTFFVSWPSFDVFLLFWPSFTYKWMGSMYGIFTVYLFTYIYHTNQPFM